MTGDTNPQTSSCGMCRLLQYGQRHFRRSQQHLANERANMPWLRLGQIRADRGGHGVVGRQKRNYRSHNRSKCPGSHVWVMWRGAGERSPIRLAVRRETGDEDRDLETLWSGHRRVVVMSMICFWSRSTGCCWGCKVDDHYANSCLIETINFDCYYHYLLLDYCLSVGPPLPSQCPRVSLSPDDCELKYPSTDIID